MKTEEFKAIQKQLSDIVSTEIEILHRLLALEEALKNELHMVHITYIK
jgi:hypothetical protein